MKRIILAATSLLLSIELLSINPAIAQSPARPEWNIVTSVTTGSPEVVLCSLRFPSEKGVPSLALSNHRQPETNAGPKGPARLVLTGLEQAPIEGQRGSIQDISIAVDNVWNVGGLTGNWYGDNSALAVFAASDILSILDPLAKGLTLSVTVPGVTAAQSFDFDLTGSRRATAELRKCLSSVPISP